MLGDARTGGDEQLEHAAVAQASRDKERGAAVVGVGAVYHGLHIAYSRGVNCVPEHVS